MSFATREGDERLSGSFGSFLPRPPPPPIAREHCGSRFIFFLDRRQKQKKGQGSLSLHTGGTEQTVRFNLKIQYYCIETRGLCCYSLFVTRYVFKGSNASKYQPLLLPLSFPATLWCSSTPSSTTVFCCVLFSCRTVPVR